VIRGAEKRSPPKRIAIVRIVAYPEVTPFWSYFLVGDQPPRTLEFAFKILD
jgi:hypothetical protein